MKMKKAKNQKSKIKTEWDLTLLYKSATDPQIEKDLRLMEKTCDDFAQKYRSEQNYLSEESALAAALADFETAIAIIGNYKPALYFHYKKDLNSEDAQASAELVKITERYTKANNKILFFELSIGKIPAEKQQHFLKSSKLAHFHYFLESLWKKSRYDLSEAEEKISNLKSQPAYSLWVDGNEKMINKQTIKWKGKELPLSLAPNLITSLPTKERHALHRLFVEKLKATSDFAEAEVNAVVINKKIEDELRGLQKPYDATLLTYETDEKTVMALVDTATKHFPVAHRFYKLKAKLLGLKRLSYADRAAPIGTIAKKISFEDSYRVLQEVFASLGQKHLDVLDSFVKQGQIDVFPKKGKVSGGYCSSSIDMPTFVLLNHANNTDSLYTFAHEMGHAMHSELCEKQTPLYQNYSTAVAETASTLYEEFMFDHEFEKMTDKEKIIALHKRINGDIQTVFRQIACFNFEVELHASIRAKGNLPKEEIAALMNKHMKSYLGPIFDMAPEDGYFFVTWSHIRRFFYVYSYAYGQLVSKALHRKYKADHSFMSKIEQFMEAGGSKSPQDIFLAIGIDTSKPAFWEEGIRAIEADIDRLEKLLAAKKK